MGLYWQIRIRILQVSSREPPDGICPSDALLLGSCNAIFHTLLAVFLLFFFSNNLVLAQQLPSIVVGGTEAIRGGRVSYGKALLHQAISEDPKHAGRQVLDRKLTPVSLASVKHGEKQVEKLAECFPVFLKPDDSKQYLQMKDWLIQRFGGRGLGFYVDFNSENPKLACYGVLAEHVAPDGNRNAFLRVAKLQENGDPVELEELWHRIVFELINLEQANATIRLDEQASKGEITRADYVQEMFFLEHESVQKTQAFYVRHFLPWVEESGFKSDPKLWYVEQSGWWDPASVFINRFPFNATYPWKVFGDRYDAENPGNASEQKS